MNSSNPSPNQSTSSSSHRPSAQAVATQSAHSQESISISPEAIDSLFAHAHQTAPIIANSTMKERCQALHQLLEHILKAEESILDQIVQETGKSRTDALVSEFLGVTEYIEWLIKKGPKIVATKKAATPLTLFGKKSYIEQQPLGTVLIISAWNYPFHITLTNLLSAWFAGNSVIIKPSEQTPLFGLLEKLFTGIPLLQNCVQIAYGGPEIGSALIDGRPDKIVFVGSQATGKAILKQASEQLIPVVLELGGKDPMIVLEDVELKRTVQGALWGGMTNSGQSCTSIEKLYIHTDIYEPFIAQLKQATESLVLNYQDQGDADVGAITSKTQLEKIEHLVSDALEKGATLLCGGTTFATEQPSANGRHFYTPTLLTNTNDSMLITHEEVFGPVMTVHRFDNIEEVIKTCNRSNFGLSASVWSQDIQRARDIASKLITGAVSINNVMLTEGNPNLPFGGTKMSGFGRLKGEEGLLTFTQSKAILVDKQSELIEPNWYPYTRQKYAQFRALIQVLFLHNPIKRLLGLIKEGTKLEGLSQRGRGE